MKTTRKNSEDALCSTMSSLSIQMLSSVGNRVLQVLSKSAPIPIPEPQRAPTIPYGSDEFLSNKGMIMSSTPIMLTPLEELPTYTLKEVSFHDNRDDCWVVVYDRIYDITTFMDEHPGGDEVLLEYAGRDATLAFRSVGHSKMAELALEPYIVGALPTKEQLWNRIVVTRSQN